MKKLRSFFSIDRALILVIGFSLYANTLSNGYSIDDSYVTQKENITAKGLKAIPEILTSFYVSTKNEAHDYRPMVKISFAVEHQFFGVHPFTSHLINVLLYLASLLLVYKFLLLLLDDPENKLPLYITLLFACLPIHTEVVASIKNRDILLCFVFTLLAVVHIVKTHRAGAHPLKNFFPAALYLICALLCKFDALPYLLIIPVLLLIKFRLKLRSFIFYLCGTLVVFVVVRVFLFFMLEGLVRERTFYSFENPLAFHKTFELRSLSLFNSLGFYVMQCILPLKQSCYYGADTLSVSSLNGYGLLGMAIVILLLAGFYYSLRKQRSDLFIGLLFFCCSITMYINFFVVAVGIVADRYAFFTSLGFCMSVVFLLKPYLLKGKIKLPVKVLAFSLFLLYGYLTLSRNADWKDAGTLIEADVQKYPNSAYLNYLWAVNLVDSIEKKRDISAEVKMVDYLKARAALEKSVAISGDHPNSTYLLCYVLVFGEKNYKLGLTYLNRALKNKKMVDLIFYKAICMRGLNRRDSCEFYLQETIRLDSASYNAYRLLAEDYNAAGQYERSIAVFDYALRKGLQNEIIYTGMATTYLAMKDTISVEFYCQKILELDPSNKKALELLQKVR